MIRGELSEVFKWPWRRCRPANRPQPAASVPSRLSRRMLFPPEPLVIAGKEPVDAPSTCWWLSFSGGWGSGVLEPAVLALAVDTKLKVCGGGVLLPAGGEITLSETTGAVSRLPNQLPKTLINRMPNQSVNDSELLMIFTRLTVAVALPLVALPARRLPVTLALPLAELREILLLI